MKKCVILIGPPCSGKSTVGKQLASNIGYEYVSSGDIARKMAEEDGTIDSLNAGKMAPEDRMREEIGDILNQGNNIILDGFPRFTEQYEWLVDRFSDRKFAFILVDAPTLLLFNRVIARGRADDTAFTERLEYYIKNTVSMINQIDCDCALYGDKLAKSVMNYESNLTVKEIERHLYDNSWI